MPIKTPPAARQFAGTGGTARMIARRPADHTVPEAWVASRQRIRYREPFPGTGGDPC